MKIVVALLGALLPAACGEKKNAADKSRTPAPKARDAAQSAGQAPAQDASVKAHMLEHFEAIRGMERALVVGDLEGAKKEARYLANHNLGEESKRFRDKALAVQNAARVFAESATAESAPAAAARLALSCGRCHLATTTITSFEWTPAPAAEGDAGSRMRRHLWAMDRLWEGLVGPSNSMWEKGAEILTSAPFPLESLLAGHRAEDPQVAALSKTLNALSKRASQAEDLEERAEIYGALLETCQQCHRKTRE